MDYLVMRLYAPLSSWGTVAVGEDRPTVNYPTRGAILGLLGAALGIKRSESQKLKDLSSSIAIASKTYAEGTILRDYHTIQTPTASKGAKFYTRRQELQSGKIETILSSRDYREDGLWIVAIWLKPSEQLTHLTHQFDLHMLQQALLYPKFTLYIGRKSCPLALPVTPKIINASSIKSALDVDIETLIPSPPIGSISDTLSSTKKADIPNWRVNELVNKVVSDRYLPTTIDYVSLSDSKTTSQPTTRSSYRMVTYHWEGSKEQMFGVEVLDNKNKSSQSPTTSRGDETPSNLYTHSHWDDPIDRIQWQFTQRVGHEWTTRELIEPINNTANPSLVAVNDAKGQLSDTDGVL